MNSANSRDQYAPDKLVESPVLSGYKIALAGLAREKLCRLITSFGATVVQLINESTNLLLCEDAERTEDDKNVPRVAAALHYKVPIMTEQQFRASLLSQSDRHDVWTERYRPRDRRSLLGNQWAVTQLYNWLQLWRKPAPSASEKKERQKMRILCGSPGTGKTTTVYVLANELGFEVKEFNASDTRSKSKLDEVLGDFTMGQPQGRLIRPRLVLMEEIDGMDGNADRGGIAVLLRAMATSRVPIVCTANRLDYRRFSKSPPFQTCPWPRPTPEDLEQLARHIIRSEEIVISVATMHKVVQAARGDFRQLITSLFLLHAGTLGGAKPKVAVADKMSLLTIFDRVKTLLTRPTGSWMQEFERLRATDPEQVFVFLFENYPATQSRARKPLDMLRRLSAAADAFGDADVYWSHSVKQAGGVDFEIQQDMSVYTDCILPVSRLFSPESSAPAQVQFPSLWSRRSQVRMAREKWQLMQDHWAAADPDTGRPRHLCSPSDPMDYMPFVNRLLVEHKSLCKTAADLDEYAREIGLHPTSTASLFSIVSPPEETNPFTHKARPKRKVTATSVTKRKKRTVAQPKRPVPRPTQQLPAQRTLVVTKDKLVRVAPLIRK